MVTLMGIGNQSNVQRLQIGGLSTDEKPIGTFDGKYIINTSTFLEMDTLDIYFYDEENQVWLKGE